MAFKIDKFLDHFDKHLDFAKVSKFDVRIAPPKGISADTYDLRFQCEAAELPGYNVNSVDNRRYGVAQPVASVPSFADITLTFICAGDMWERKLFDQWMNIVIPINNYNPNYKENYTSPKIEIVQYNEASSSNNTEQSPYAISLFEAFPITVAPMQLNWGDDAIHRLAVTFKYNYWSTLGIENRGAPTVARPTGAERTRTTGSTVPVSSGISLGDSTRTDRGILR